MTTKQCECSFCKKLHPMLKRAKTYLLEEDYVSLTDYLDEREVHETDRDYWHGKYHELLRRVSEVLDEHDRISGRNIE